MSPAPWAWLVEVEKIHILPNVLIDSYLPLFFSFLKWLSLCNYHIYRMLWRKLVQFWSNTQQVDNQYH